MRVESILDSLGISVETLAARSLVLHPEASELVSAETGADGRQHLLVPAAARAWGSLREAAQADGVNVRIVSAFRSIERQAEIVRAKLARGQSIDEILRVSAPPGYSEHHTGRAVDVTTNGVRPLGWLSRHAGRFGFCMSYARENRYGYMYEPWHWCWLQEGNRT